MLKKQIGQRLRIVIGMQKQTEFALEMGTTPQTINDYLGGRSFPPEAFLFKLAKERKVNLNWLVTGEGPVYTEPAKNLEAVERIPELAGMKTVFDQFTRKVAEVVDDYNKKVEKFETEKKVKKK